MKFNVPLLATVLVLGCAHVSTAKPAAPPAQNPIELDFSPSIRSKLSATDKQARSSLTCPRVSEPPKIDGSIDDASWKKALVMDALKPSTPPTRVLVAYDADNLYIAFACTQPGGAPLRATKYAHNTGTPWKDDC